jgi:hypothetical protein
VKIEKRRGETRREGGNIFRPPVARIFEIWTKTLGFISVSLYGR